MNKKLVFFDIDGTLAMPTHPVSPAVADAIRRLRANGHMAFLGTGRAEAIVPPEIKAIGFDGGIYSAGGRTAVGGHEVSSHAMSEEMTRRIIDILSREDMLFYVLETATGNICGNSDVSFDNLDFRGGSTELLRVQQIFTQGSPKKAEDYDGEPVYKVSYFCAPKERMDRLEKTLSELGKVVRFDNMVPDSPLFSGEITSEGTDKGRALTDICRYCGADPADSIAFGDSINDVEMLTAAGIGVAMGNSEPRVKELADRICETCDEDGVVHELERMGLI